LDRVLLGSAVDGIVDFSGEAGTRRDALQLRGRLQRLELMELAQKLGRNTWQLAADMREILVAAGERGDIVRAVNRALKGTSRDISFDTRTMVIGRVAGKGFADELRDQPYLIVDGIDGRAHFVRMPVGAELSEYPFDSIVEACIGKR